MAQSQGIRWHGGRVKRAAREGAARGLALAGAHLLGEAQAIVPHETGDLERSGRWEIDEANLRVVVYFDTPYAVRQHEEMNYQHEGGRQAKYLETPANREGPVMQELIAAQIRRALQ